MSVKEPRVIDIEPTRKGDTYSWQQVVEVVKGEVIHLNYIVNFVPEEKLELITRYTDKMNKTLTCEKSGSILFTAPYEFTVRSKPCR